MTLSDELRRDAEYWDNMGITHFRHDAKQMRKAADHIDALEKRVAELEAENKSLQQFRLAVDRVYTWSEHRKFYDQVMRSLGRDFW